MKTLVINRDKDKRRLAFVKDEVARHPELEFERFKAIDAFDADFSVKGSLPPGISFDAPIPQDLKKRGNYGCQLSHVACWHSVAQGDAPVLILEDDAGLTENVERMIRDLSGLGSFDLVFVNERTRRYRQRLDAIKARGAFLRLDAYHMEMCRLFGLRDFDVKRADTPWGILRGAPGTDGYVVSPGGAAKLLAAFAEFRVFAPADWFIYTLGLDPATLAAFPGGPRVVHRISGKMIKREYLRDMYIYEHIVAKHSSGRVGGSVRGETQVGN